MNYFIDLFTEETFNKFLKSKRTISGFKPRQEYLAKKVSVGDKIPLLYGWKILLGGNS